MQIRKLLLPAFTALAFLPVSGQIVQPTSAGLLTRARVFYNTDNIQAATDCLEAIDISVLGAGSEASCMWLKAQTFYADADFVAAQQAFEAFADAYPGSPLRTVAALRVADCLYARGEYAEALAAYRGIDAGALTSDQAAQLHYRLACCAVETGDNELAYEEFEQALSSPLFASAARFELGVLAYGRGEYEQAKELLNSVDTSRRPGDMAPYYLAAIYLVTGDYRQAANTARAMQASPILSDAQKAEMYRVAGEALFHLGSTADAMSQLRMYLEAVDEPSPRACYAAGILEYNEGNYARAVELLNRATEAPDQAVAQSAYLYIGQALHHRGDDAAAILAFDKALKIDDGDKAVREVAYYNYAVALSNGGAVPFASSDRVFEDFLRLYPSGVYSDRVRSYLAERYIADKDYDRALERLQGMKNPDRRTRRALQRVLYLMGADRYSRGKYAEAADLLKRAGDYSSADADMAAEVTVMQAGVEAAKGNHAAAANLYRKYLTGKGNRPNATAVYYGLGYALMATEDMAGARDAFSKIEDNRGLNDRQKADVLNRLADIAYADHRFEEAASLYRRAYLAAPAQGDYSAFQGARMLGFARNYPDKLARIDAFIKEFLSSPLVPDAMLERTQALISLGRNDEAVETYYRLTSGYGGTTQGRRGYLEMAMTLLEMNRTDEAMKAYRDVISLYPTSDEAAQASQLLKNLYSDQDRAGEYLSFMESVDNAPKVSRADTERLTYQAAVSDFEKTGSTAGLEEYLVAFPDAPNAPAAILAVAESRYKADRLPEAFELYSQAQSKVADGASLTEARLGAMRSARDMGDLEVAANTAVEIINSSAPQAAVAEAAYTRGMALEAAGDADGAISVWETQAYDTANLYGIKCAVSAAEAMLENGDTDGALEAARAITGSGSTHRYWVARAFIVMSDAYRKAGKDFEAREYLEALRQNYPGDEADIFSMIESRLEQ